MGHTKSHNQLEAKVMHENIKGSQLVQVEKAGHGFYFEERGRVNSELIKFIG